jgi:hypothetical protein
VKKRPDRGSETAVSIVATRFTPFRHSLRPVWRSRGGNSPGRLAVLRDAAAGSSRSKWRSRG